MSANNRKRKEIIENKRQEEEKRIEAIVGKKLEEALRNNDKKKSFIPEVSQKSWYIIITLLVTLMGAAGGYPAIKSLFESPEFKFRGEGIMIGNAGNKTSILLIGSIVNTGQKPLLISRIRLRILLNDSAYEATPVILSNKMHFTGETEDGKTFELRAADLGGKDLQRISELPPQQTITGDLLFTTSIAKNELITDNVPFELLCEDINGKKYKDKVEYERVGIKKGMYPVYPKSNMYVEPYNSTDTSRNK